jgi:hypothetical protein
MLASIAQLEEENHQLTDKLHLMEREYEQLQRVFKQHTGKELEQFAASPSTVAPTETIDKPPVNINIEPQSAVSIGQLDGAILSINGVQYRMMCLANNR